MKLSKERIAILSKILTDKLTEKRYIDLTAQEEQFISRIEQIITEDMMTEERLNHEVKVLLKAYESEIEKGNIDYWKMFNMIKNKLVKERGLVL